MIINKHDSEIVAKILLKINAIKLQPNNFFTWASGKKAPIYCDNRILLSYVKERGVVRDLFCKNIKMNYANIDYIAGVATGAIAHGLMVAEKLELPFIYVRDKAKKYGRKNQIEGSLTPNSNVLVIEDLVSTGKSSLKAIEAIEKSGSNAIGLMSIFTYDMTTKIDLPYLPLCNYSTLINVASSNKIITEEEKDILSNWKQKMG